MTYPDLKNEPELLKIKTRDDEIKNLKYQTERHDHENILKSPKLTMNIIKKKYKNLKRKESFFDYHRNTFWCWVCRRQFMDGFDQSWCWYCYFI